MSNPPTHNIEQQIQGSLAQRLRCFRSARGLSVRAVADQSLKIAAQRKDARYAFSYVTLLRLERDEVPPHIFRLQALAEIYSVSLAALTSSKEAVISDHNLANTRSLIVPTDILSGSKSLTVTLLLKPGLLKESQNSFISCLGDLVENVIQIEAALKGVQGPLLFVGQDKLRPLIEPQSIVVVDDKLRDVPQHQLWRVDKHLFVLECRRDQYEIGWCERLGSKLIVTYPSHRYKERLILEAQNVDVIGRVTSCIMHLSKQCFVARVAGDIHSMC